MKHALLAVAWTASVALAQETPLTVPQQAKPEGYSNTFNVQWAKAKEHRFPLNPEDGAALKPGVFADMSDPDSPRLLEHVGLKTAPRARQSVSRVFTEVASSRDAQLSASSLRVNAKASYLGFIKAKFEYSSEEMSSDRDESLYFVISEVSGVEAVGDGLKWDPDNPVPKDPVARQRLEQFTQLYGTHYVQRLYFGKMIVIRATVRETEQENRMKASAALRAAFYGFSLKGEAAKAVYESTKQYRFDLRAEVLGGKCDKRERLLIRDMASLMRFVEDYEKKEIVIEEGVIGATAYSLAPFVPDNTVRDALRGTTEFVDTDKLDTVRDELHAALGRSFGKTVELKAPSVELAGTRTGGSGSARTIEIRVNGNSVVHSDSKYSSLTLPVKAGQRYEMYASTDGSDNPEKRNINPDDLVVTWMPIGIKAQPAKK
jgi:hypothetical protein